MSKENTAQMPIGSIVSTIKKIQDDNWICCNGEKYENTNNIYGELIKMGIGKLNRETNMYELPNYQNMEMVARNKITEKHETQLLENYHFYNMSDIRERKDENLMSDYRNKADNWFNGVINYFIKNRVLFNDNKVEVFWFIKYKN